MCVDLIFSTDFKSSPSVQFPKTPRRQRPPQRQISPFQEPTGSDLVGAGRARLRSQMHSMIDCAPHGTRPTAQQRSDAQL